MTSLFYTQPTKHWKYKAMQNYLEFLMHLTASIFQEIFNWLY